MPLSDIDTDTRHDWRHLADSVGANPSLYPSWTNAIAESHGIAKDSYIVAAHQAHQASALYPLTISNRKIAGFGYRSLELVTNRASYHNQTISLLNPEQELELLLEEAERQSADVVSLSGISDSSTIGRYLNETTGHRSFYKLMSPGESSPYLSLNLSWDELLNSKPKKFRYKARQRAKTLTNSSDLRMQWFSDINDCSQFLEAVRLIEKHSWKKDAGIAIVDRPIERRYHEILLPLLASEGAMFGNVLLKDDAPIAYSLCCISGGWAGQLKTSFDTRFSDISPGGIVIDNAIQRAIDYGASEFDFLGDSDPHKLAWTKNTRTHTNYSLYLTSTYKGRVIGKLKEIRARYTR